MIITVTPNPSVDRTIALDSLRRGAVQRATDNREDPGGKGINVSRALALHGTATTAVLPVGGHYGRMMTDLLGEIGLPVRPVPITDSIRANVALVEPDGTTTKVNELGPVLTDAEIDALDSTVRDAVSGGGVGGSGSGSGSGSSTVDWVVGCGSLPRGLGVDYYARLVEQCRDLGVKIAIDSSGEPMTHALAASPDLIKPNREELAEAVGAELGTVQAVVDAAHTLNTQGIETVVVSLGRDGALLVSGDTVIHAKAVITNPLSTVGAGDSLLAGYLHATAGGASPADAMRTAVAFGAAAVCLPGSQMPTPEDVAAIHVDLTESPDPALPLTD